MGGSPAPAREDRFLPAGRESLRFDADTEGRLAASVYSLPAAFFEPAEALAFLTAVRALDPHRDLLVLADGAVRAGLVARASELRLDLIDTGGRAFSPWPRDPFSLVHGGDRRAGRVVVLARPNLQPGREADADMARALAESLPGRLDSSWGGVRWSRAAVPFHNGQVLLAPGAAWISLHTLEPRILGMLKLDRVPVASFATAAGTATYLAAAERARAELEGLYGRPVRWVHPVPPLPASPANIAPGNYAALMTEIGGGAGYDLDSIVTLLPDGAGTRALVADLAAGRSLLARLPAGDWDALRHGYDLGPQPARLPALLSAAQETPRATALSRYLDLIAAQLAVWGLRVDRLPLLLVPVSLLREPGNLQGVFLLGWNNVVVQSDPAGGVRAEGFASLLPTGDAQAKETFARAGCRLDLLPPLVESVVRNGGYRCASNHLRAPASPAATPGSAPAGRPAAPRRPAPRP
jgi:hypothetical protein